KAAPVWLRSRILLRLARHLVHDTYTGSRAIARLRRGTASIDVRASVFCSVREPVNHPLCGFYAAAFTRLMTMFDIGASTEAAAVLLADDLNALGASAITRGERHQAFERLQVPPAAALTDATVIRIGQVVGAAQVVVGSLRLDAESIVVRARSIALDSGRIVADVTERGGLPELFAIFERIARRIAPPSAKTSEELARRYPPVDVFEDYIKG